MATLNADEESIFKLFNVLSLEGIQLSAWCNTKRTQLLALYSKGKVFHFCYFQNVKPVVKKVPWYKDSVHTPSALTFSPDGSFLIVVSTSCHLYVVPVLQIFDPDFKSDVLLDSKDVSIYPYPFHSKIKTQRRKSSSSNNISSDFSNETFKKLKDMSGKGTDACATSVAWWLSLQDAQHVAVIGTNSGRIILVDLSTGIRLRDTLINGPVKNLSICIDDYMETVFLLVMNKEAQQFRIILEQKLERHGKDRSRGSSPSDDGEEDNTRRISRGRLHGLKQMSVDKLAEIMTKIAESRARAQLKPGDEVNGKQYLSLEPSEICMKDTIVRLQNARGHYFLTGFHPHSRLLTTHSMSLKGSPLSVHKLPEGSEECLLGDRLIYTVSRDRSQVSVVSPHLSKSRLEPDAEFNPDCILASCNIESTVSSSETDSSDEFLNETEQILALYKGRHEVPKLNIPDDWKVDSLPKLLDKFGEFEPCYVVTTNNVYIYKLATHMVGTILHLILDKHALVQAERMCKIFELNLSNVLEVAGDIELARLKFPAAIALFKLATCEPLRITGKLARLGHCWELLSYCSALSAAPSTNFTLKARMHISNLLPLSFMHQILQGGGQHIKRKFLIFLEENNYYDKMLTISLAGQSLLFSVVHKLIYHKGLIVEGFIVIVKLIRDFRRNELLFETAEIEDMWNCFTEPNLQEALPCRKELFPVFAHFISVHMSHLTVPQLERLCRLLDPLSPCLRPLMKLPFAEGDQENRDSFPLDQLVQMFLVILLVKLNKEGELVYNKQLMLPEPDPSSLDSRQRTQSESDSVDLVDEPIWAIRKDRRDSSYERDRCKSRILSCGYGHTALIRNGAVITWGSSNKDCLGNGPIQALHATPEAIPWFGIYKLQVSQVSCGRNHTVALTNNGVYTWGSSQYGQLGLGDVHDSPNPRLVVLLGSQRVTSVVCGQYHTLALTSSGSLYSYGWNVHGQLGLGNIENVRTPTLINTLKEHVIIDMAAGHGHSLVLTDTGHLYSFGSGVFGQLGNGTSAKSTIPVLVKGITGRVCHISSAYFHNLALTTSNSLFIWGCSPQALRLQAQAHKHARASHNQAAVSEPDPETFNSTSDGHLSPSVVDTSNVTGKIVQIACGCHHSALITESGDLYTWGRSMDGQLGNGSRTEVILPSLLKDRSFKVSAVSLGCDFSVALDKAGSKVYAWGSNGSGQVGLPIKDVPAKASDGKLIIVKTEKRIMRVPNSLANLVDSPVEVPDIPPSTFTYQPLNSSSSEPTDPSPTTYTSGVWHRTLQTCISLVNPDLLLCKCLELGNHQAASKLLFLQGQIRQSLVHQLKALQHSQKQRKKERDETNEKHRELEKMKSVQTPSEEIQLFAVQGGNEGMCDMTDTSLEGIEDVRKTDEAKDIDMVEYINTALEILLKYLLHAPDCTSDILETGIQFWSAQNLPFPSLEEFLEEHLERVFYPLGCLMYLSKRDFSRHFSSKFQLTVTSRLINHVESNGDCTEFLAVLSRLLSLGAKTSVADISVKLQNPPQKAIQITWPAVTSEAIYVFSCGHTTTRISLPSDHEKLIDAYAKLDTEGVVEMACPDCVCGLLSAQVA